MGQRIPEHLRASHRARRIALETGRMTGDELLIIGHAPIILHVHHSDGDRRFELWRKHVPR